MYRPIETPAAVSDGTWVLSCGGLYALEYEPTAGLVGHIVETTWPLEGPVSADWVAAYRVRSGELSDAPGDFRFYSVSADRKVLTVTEYY